MHAVVKIAGRQYCVSPEEIIKVAKLGAEPGDEVTITDVIMVADGGETQVGTPLLPYQVKLEIIEHGRDKKLIVRRYVRRGGMRRKRGHRQHFSRVRVKAIEQGE